MGESTERFVRRQNIERYRSLLAQMNDQSTRQTLLALLAEEERRQRDAADPVTIDLDGAVAIRLALSVRTGDSFDSNQGNAD